MGSKAVTTRTRSPRHEVTTINTLPRTGRSRAKITLLPFDNFHPKIDRIAKDYLFGLFSENKMSAFVGTRKVLEIGTCRFGRRQRSPIEPSFPIAQTAPTPR